VNPTTLPNLCAGTAAYPTCTGARRIERNPSTGPDRDPGGGWGMQSDLSPHGHGLHSTATHPPPYEQHYEPCEPLKPTESSTTSYTTCCFWPIRDAQYRRHGQEPDRCTCQPASRGPNPKSSNLSAARDCLETTSVTRRMTDCLSHPKCPLCFLGNKERTFVPPIGCQRGRQPHVEPRPNRTGSGRVNEGFGRAADRERGVQG
jgi:hypothetical protein